MGLYYHTDLQICVATCNVTDYMLDFSNSNCVRCFAESWINEGGTCKAGPDCDTLGYDPDPMDENRCKTCVDLGKFFNALDGTCVNGCPADYTPDPSGNCVECKLNNTNYFFN